MALEESTTDYSGFVDKTLANAERLAADSVLLIDNDRAYSAIMLAIFAIEEMGKALINRWGVRNKKHCRPYPSHVEKQSAMFALLAAVELSQMPKSELQRIRDAGRGFHEMGPLSSQFAFARSGFFDDFRMAVTYADQQPKLPLHELEKDDVSVALATEVLGWFEQAKEAVNNGLAMELASVIFENDLGRM